MMAKGMGYAAAKSETHPGKPHGSGRRAPQSASKPFLDLFRL